MMQKASEHQTDKRKKEKRNLCCFMFDGKQQQQQQHRKMGIVCPLAFQVDANQRFAKLATSSSRLVGLVVKKSSTFGRRSLCEFQ